MNAKCRLNFRTAFAYHLPFVQQSQRFVDVENFINHFVPARDIEKLK